mmetsp:Transcript_17112/g.36953  ORF Transcript_17112/g.36953 Transcript_17112/m.36953 type:complete len:97 (+) Transcript_17112:172-462(+)
MGGTSSIASKTMEVPIEPAAGGAGIDADEVGEAASFASAAAESGWHRSSADATTAVRKNSREDARDALPKMPLPVRDLSRSPSSPVLIFDCRHESE